jgi:uncharacterized phage-associated protein
MTYIQFHFNRAKAIEVILYLAQNVTESDIYGICKLVYLADKTSLEKYGRFIFGESYFAMEGGAAPSNVYDLLKEASYAPLDGIRVDGGQVIALREAKLDNLSKSDIECLNQIITVYGKVPNWKRGQDTHDNAWREAWEKRGKKLSIRMPIESIAKLLSDPDDILGYLRNSDG